MAELSEPMASSELAEYKVVRGCLSHLIDKILPEEISDDLFSSSIIDESLYMLSFDTREPRKNRARKLIKAVLDAIKSNPSIFSKFCTILEKSQKESIRNLGNLLRGDLDNLMKLSITTEESKSTSPALDDLKEQLTLLRKSLFQSDENVEAKHVLIKEHLAKFIRLEFMHNAERSTVKEQLEEICYVDRFVPQKLHKWCFEQYESILAEVQCSTDKCPVSKPKHDSKPPLLNKDSIYHATLLAKCVSSCDDESSAKFFRSHPHEFEHFSISRTEKKDEGIEQYLLARKGKVLYAAFQGEPDLCIWQKKYSSMTIAEVITKQKDEVPIRFFVDYIAKGYQIIFTGFSFGALLAISVFAEVWKQPSIQLDDLIGGIGCIAFGAPFIDLQDVGNIFNTNAGIKDNCYLFHAEDDAFPQLLQCAEVSNHEEPSRTGVTEFHTTFSGVNVFSDLSILQSLHSHHGKSSEETSSSMASLRDGIKHTLNSYNPKKIFYGLMHFIYRSGETFMISTILDAVNDQFPSLNASFVDSLQADIFKKHSMQRYYSLLGQCFFKSTDFGGKYDRPKTSDVPQPFPSLKPEIKRAKFSRHADEVALVLEGKNLWFCHKIKIKSLNTSKVIELSGKFTTDRSIIYNYVPASENDLLIDDKDSTIDVTLYSHFSKPISKCRIETEKMVDYALSFRQRQLAPLTPSEVIQLSILSAVLERPSLKYKNSGHQSKRLSTIIEFLNLATRVVPVESICHAIENESEINAWKCAEALISSKYKLPPSYLFSISLQTVLCKLATGYDQRALGRIACNVVAPDGKVNLEIDYPSEKVVLRASSRKQGKFSTKNPLLASHQRAVSKVGTSHSISLPFRSSTYKSKTAREKILMSLISMLQKLNDPYQQRICLENVLCGENIDVIYPSHCKASTGPLNPPIDFFKNVRKKLLALHEKAKTDIATHLSDEDNVNQLSQLFNDEMTKIVDELMSEDIAICLSILGGFMECQIHVPFVNSPQETAHLLQTMKCSSAIGVWTLFSLSMMDLETLLTSNKGRLLVDVEKYIEGILSKRDHARSNSPDRGSYAGKLQFLMLGIGESVSCNTQYIGYSLERQLSVLCKKFDIKPSTEVKDLVKDWNTKFEESILFYVMKGYRPLLARWLIWSLNIHKLREEIASHTTIGIVGLSNSGKSCLINELFKVEAVSGTACIQRTTVPFLYNLEGFVDGLSVIDFPGVDDKDNAVVKIANILLQLSQLIILVIDFRKCNSQAAEALLKLLDDSGRPVLLCLTHGDKLYADACLKIHGNSCDINVSKRIIARELEMITSRIGSSSNRKTVLCSFSQDADSFLNCEEGREILSANGIYSCQYVGEWLCSKLDDLKLPTVVKSLKTYLESNTNFYSVDGSDSSSIKGLPERDIETMKSVSLEENDGVLNQLPRKIRSVTILAESEVVIQGCGQKVVDWPGRGLKITIPDGALLQGECYNISVKLVTSKEFEMPSDTKVVSGFYWIFSSLEFLKPVNVQLQHCVHIDNEQLASKLTFAIARCDQEQLPYKFKIRNGIFLPNENYGSLSLKSFSILSILVKLSAACIVSMSPWLQCPISYQFQVFGRKKRGVNTWQFDFVFCKDLEHNITETRKKYLNAGWIIELPCTRFQFDTDSVALVPLKQQQIQGWKIKYPSCQKIFRCYASNGDQSTAQQSWRIALQWTMPEEPSQIEYPVKLNGAKYLDQVSLHVPLLAAEAAVQTDDCERNLVVHTAEISIDCILRKSPIPNHLYKLLKGKSSNWNDIGREFGIDYNFRQSIKGTPKDNLEEVIQMWVSSQPTEVTWKKVIDVLRELEYIDTVQSVEEFLRKPEIFQSYKAQNDFNQTVRTLG